MPLADQFAELDSIAQMIVEELALIRCMRCQGEAPEPAAEARSLAAGISLWALLLPVLQLEALRLEQEAAWVA